jgi:ceramide glucosyltransferase
MTELIGVHSRKRYRTCPSLPLPSTPRSSAPGVSILRPLKGLDSNLSECLESSFKQDYPNFEILLSVADEDDEALPIVHELIAKYPNVNARVVIGALTHDCI